MKFCDICGVADKTVRDVKGERMCANCAKIHFDPEDIVFACDELAELQQHNALLKVQNKELLARCDLLEVELCRYQREIETIMMTLEEI